MKWLVKLLLTALAVFLIDMLLDGVVLEDYGTAVIVALVLALLNTFVKPLLVFFTLPITVFTLGLFLIIVNAAIILLASKFVDGFYVDGIGTAILFSFLLWAIRSLLHSLLKED